MAEERARLILTWLEEHPEIYAKVRAKLGELAATQKRLRPIVREAVMEKAKQIAAETEFREKVDRAAVAAITSKRALELLRATSREYEDQLTRTRATLVTWGEAVARVGWRLGFFGWILSYAVRGLARYGTTAMATFRKLIDLTADWTKGIVIASTAIGLLGAYGMVSEEALGYLHDTIIKLTEIGPKIEGLKAGFETLLRGIAATVLDAALPALEDFLNELLELAASEEFQNWLRDIIREATEAFLPALLDCIRGWVRFADALRPLIPVLADLLRWIGPIAPLFIILGSVLWVLGPVLTSIGTLFKGISWLLGVLPGIVSGVSSAFTALTGTISGGVGVVGAIKGAFLGLKAVLIGIGPIGWAIIAVVTAIILIILHWKQVVGALQAAWSALVAFYNTHLRPGLIVLANLFKAIGYVIFQLGRLIVGLFYAPLKLLYDHAIVPLGTFLASVLIPAFDAIVAALMPVYKWLKDVATLIINVVLGAIREFLRYVEQLTGWLFDLGDTIGGLADALFSVCFEHALASAESFREGLLGVEEETRRSIDLLREMGGVLEELPSPRIGVGPPAARVAGPQYVTVYSTVEIAEVSGTADIEMVVDAVNRGIAEALEEARE